MIAIDTSAIVAIAFNEPERELFLSKILGSTRTLICAPTLVEARIVVRSKGSDVVTNFVDEFLALPKFEVVHADKDIADIANRAYINYGKGSGHPAQLNFGDVFSYAVAKHRSAPLLFKGNDFSQTDITSATL